MHSSARASSRVGVDKRHDGSLDAPRRLTVGLVVVMAAQSVAGLLHPEEYRDAEWIKATWFGNDWVTVAVVVPLMGLAVVRQHERPSRWLLVWAGTLAYAIYNYAFYLFGAALSLFFPLYVASLALAIVVLILLVGRLDGASVARRFSRNTPVRTIGGYFIVIGVGLSSVWIAIWGAYVFGGRPTPVDPEAFKIIAALDLVLMVPALMCGGAFLWMRHRMGYVLASIAGIQAALYLTVLSVNSLVAIRRGLTAAPGELPMWVPLAIATSAATGLLIANMRERTGER
jgi:hypothetical protein